MKRILSLVLICFSCVSMSAQKPYAIYDFSGQIRFKENKTPQWISAQKNQPVNGLDSIDISSKGFVRIIDTRTNQIFKSTITGKTRVLTIINEAKKQSARTLSALNQEMLNGSKAQSGTPTMQVVGATTRGDDATIEDSVATTFAYIAQQSLQNKLNGSDEIQLIPKKKGKEISFIIASNSEKGYFVNVLRINKATQTVSLCYVLAEELLESDELPCLYLPQHQRIDLSDIRFVDNSDDLFVLVATDDLYRTESVAAALKYISLSDIFSPKYEKFIVGNIK